MKWRVLLLVGLVVGSGSVVAGGSVDLGRPFTCLDVSPMPMRITGAGLVMGGVLYPIIDPNASLSPRVTNAIFGGQDGLSEINVMQFGDGRVNVSYMKFKYNPYELGVDPDKAKVYEKASYSVENPPVFFKSKNQGCKN